MYQEFFGFNELPFSIVPNSRFLFLSQRHKEAMTYLQSGLGDGGGFAMLTGEVGTGKTTVAKAMIAQLPESTIAGFILNPTFSERELLESICDEFSVEYREQASLKQLSKALQDYLISQDKQGKQVLLVIDEAQHLAPDVLEQLRLLTNLETEQRKLLKVLLVGQPELQQKLQLPQLRQLAQRITARYHILPLNPQEVAQYIRFRLEKAGGSPDLFPASACRWIAKHTHSIPRLINLVCDAALKSAYQSSETHVSFDNVKQATAQIMSFQSTIYQDTTSPMSSAVWLKPATNFILGGVCSVALWLCWPLIAQPILEQRMPLPSLPTPITHQVIPAPVKKALEQSSDREQAMNTLFSVWGYQASVADMMCQNDHPSQLQCSSASGDWAQLAKRNLPVVLELDMNGMKRYAVLYHLNGQQADLLLEGQRYQLATQWLEPYWKGQYFIAWHHQFTRTLKLGMQGQDVRMLNHKLAGLLKVPDVDSTEFDQALQKKVALFQNWQKMTEDGVAGERTLQKIEMMSQHNAPQLKESRHEK
ncbi:AAA family ATPase [Vibrio sp. CAIM 722]|uniref:AAA family ATPase n=1 Tax=Vibrio eleionomae TaxID=2653505 RepID=A0A7X4LIF8_9VIBR|nr:AAA family ATPase [Vibrio eleionomae]MZI92519.1 AAA family ATPase [Vibrio eleionomae]